MPAASSQDIIGGEEAGTVAASPRAAAIAMQKPVHAKAVDCEMSNQASVSEVKEKTANQRTKRPPKPEPASTPEEVDIATVEEGLREALKDSNTSLNKASAERDRYRFLYEQAAHKLSEHTRIIFDLKAEIQALKDFQSVLRDKGHKYKMQAKRNGTAPQQQQQQQHDHEAEKCDMEFAHLQAAYADLLMRHSSSFAAADSAVMNSEASPDLSEDGCLACCWDTGPAYHDMLGIHATTWNKAAPSRGRPSRNVASQEHGNRYHRPKVDDKKRRTKEQSAERQRLSQRFEERQPGNDPARARSRSPVKNHHHLSHHRGSDHQSPRLPPCPASPSRRDHYHGQDYMLSPKRRRRQQPHSSATRPVFTSPVLLDVPVPERKSKSTAAKTHGYSRSLDTGAYPGFFSHARQGYGLDDLYPQMRRN